MEMPAKRGGRREGAGRKKSVPDHLKRSKVVSAKVEPHLKEWAQCQSEGESEFIRALLLERYNASVIA